MRIDHCIKMDRIKQSQVLQHMAAKEGAHPWMDIIGPLKGSAGGDTPNIDGKLEELNEKYKRRVKFEGLNTSGFYKYYLQFKEGKRHEYWIDPRFCDLIMLMCIEVKRRWKVDEKIVYQKDKGMHFRPDLPISEQIKNAINPVKYESAKGGLRTDGLHISN